MKFVVAVDVVHGGVYFSQGSSSSSSSSSGCPVIRP